MFDPAKDSINLLINAASTGWRSGEPVRVGMPFPRGWCRKAEELRLRTGTGDEVPHQLRLLESWSDGSVRWALLDFIVTARQRSQSYELHRGTSAAMCRPDPPGPGDGAGRLRVRKDDRGVRIETGRSHFAVTAAGELRVHGSEHGAAVCQFRLVRDDGTTLSVVDSRDVVVEETGPIRASVVVQAVVDPSGLQLQCRYEFFVDSSTVTVSATLRNPYAAVHRGGFWDLGDPHSRFLREFAFKVSPEGSLATVSCSAETGSPPCRFDLPFDVYQESSGGEHWASSNHVNRNGIVPLTFRGYRIRSSNTEVDGGRATPLLEALDRAGKPIVTIGMQHFWERFPKAIAVDADSVTLGLLPRQFPDVHEIQPGEQLTERFAVSFGSDASLQWVREPAVVRAEPEWYCAAEAMPHLSPAADDADPKYQAYVNRALDAVHGFVAKREWIDEFGWRNFGDLYADHEAVFHQKAVPLVSHYNNQYDAIAGFAIQFFRTGDERWLELMRELARHVIDVDVYHTADDKPAYSGGMFWHTNHHIDAGTATHRTYPRAAGGGGGPSAEHNYSTGLLLHYFMSGETSARDAAIQLADWVIAMDDGRRTPLRWISRGPTGLASATGSLSYHGPGRGPGNGIVVLINAWRLTHERRYLLKVEELIRRCVHPAQDLDGLNLLDAERRWYYTVFLQSLARYLDCKSELGEFDNGFSYARGTLLHYARWMAIHERPYLETPERLDYPNETWIAQDMRKAEVFDLASKYASREDERSAFTERAQFFFDYVLTTLPAMQTSTLMRPLVLLLTNGYSHHAVAQWQEVSAPESTGGPDHVRFVPQRQVALRRVRAAAVIAAVSLILLLVVALVF